MKEKKIAFTKKDLMKYAENPFADMLSGALQTKTKTVAWGKSDKSIVDTETGEITNTSYIGIKKEYDKEEFVKVFMSGVQAMFDLEKAGLNVFKCIMSAYLKKTKTGVMDQIYINHKIAKRDYGYANAKATWHRGMNELLIKKFLAEFDDNMYWVNPELFFKGDRAVFVHDYRVRREKSRQIDVFEEDQPLISE